MYCMYDEQGPPIKAIFILYASWVKVSGNTLPDSEPLICDMPLEIPCSPQSSDPRHSQIAIAL